jgi:multiple antibiotic resistance protein
MELSEIIKSVASLWAVIDPVGTVPVFIAVTKKHADQDKRKIALQAVLISAGILIFFLAAGQLVLDAMEVPLDAFQVAGAIILFLFALTMIFGESRPEQEVQLTRHYRETAIFPLAAPSIASPGAMMAVVLLTDNHRFSIPNQIVTGLIVLGVLFITYLMLLCAAWIYRKIGDSGASILSRVMGMLLASVAASSVLGGVKTYFSR